jgi:hypothetical protein
LVCRPITQSNFKPVFDSIRIEAMNTNLDRLADLAKGIGTGEKPECETCGGLGGLFTGGGTWDGDCHDCKKEEKPLEMR